MHEAMAKKDWPRLNTLFRECPRNARWANHHGQNEQEGGQQKDQAGASEQKQDVAADDAGEAGGGEQQKDQAGASEQKQDMAADDAGEADGGEQQKDQADASEQKQDVAADGDLLPLSPEDPAGFKLLSDSFLENFVQPRKASPQKLGAMKDLTDEEIDKISVEEEKASEEAQQCKNERKVQCPQCRVQCSRRSMEEKRSLVHGCGPQKCAVCLDNCEILRKFTNCSHWLCMKTDCLDACRLRGTTQRQQSRAPTAAVVAPVASAVAASAVVAPVASAVAKYAERILSKAPEYSALCIAALNAVAASVLSPEKWQYILHVEGGGFEIQEVSGAKANVKNNALRAALQKLPVFYGDKDVMFDPDPLSKTGLRKYGDIIKYLDIKYNKTYKLPGLSEERYNELSMCACGCGKQAFFGYNEHFQPKYKAKKSADWLQECRENYEFVYGDTGQGPHKLLLPECKSTRARENRAAAVCQAQGAEQTAAEQQDACAQQRLQEMREARLKRFGQVLTNSPKRRRTSFS
jgi:hypothetical protein